jgi:hypothetical protein
MRVPKRVKKIGWSALILFIAFFTGGFIYTYYSDSNSPVNNTTKITPVNYAPIKPPKTSPKADESVAADGFDSPLAPGNETTLLITTLPYSTCTISVSYGSVKSTNPALGPKKADAFGSVTWSWFVPSNTPFGTYPVDIRCSYGSKWAMLDEALVVKQ